ncbi:hypothetical protein ABL78_7255 [Leptomonas seymouri]|uniref:SURP motif domain-containing protein n=1 Tax=Leptomonas seymouri TaxID=5684 RepID=A0A0N1PAE1_LEPSE|nr:hypothetical protein ABL78_7255 [Leptomonas seymouri]|eukprot:KPI83704.1 hypothetical protein ABL78_7255 [Leptomonas seymouri]
MSGPPSTPPGPAEMPFTTMVAEDDADNDVGHDNVGFESMTVLFDSGHASSAVSVSDAAPTMSNAAPSPYALYEPLHAQQQSGVLDAFHPAGSGPAVLSGASDSAGVLGPPTGPSILHFPQPQPPAQPYSYVEEGLDVPLHAPRLRVPTDLPLEQTTLMDLLAMMVVQGGPTTEEEIVKREVTRRNPAFAFLGEKFNNPCLLYYRWRLYSLLQQDTLLDWRTAPFQMERARRAYVFVPPPVPRVGPDCLAGLHQPALLHPTEELEGGEGVDGGRGEGKRGREHGEGEEDDADAIILCKARRRHRRHGHHAAAADQTSEGEKATACSDEGTSPNHSSNGNAPACNSKEGEGVSRNSSSRSGTESSESSSTDSGSDSEVPPSTTKEADSASTRSCEESHGSVADKSSTPATTAALGSKGAMAEMIPLPPPSAQWISRQCILSKSIFAVLQPQIRDEWVRLLCPRLICAPSACASIKELCDRWLSRDEVATRMSFAVQHADGIHHLLSILLDAMVKTAYMATARSRAPPPPSSLRSLENDSNVFCVEALWYLFVLHDILMNASNMVGGPAATACCVNKNTRPTPTAQPSVGGEEEEPFAALDGSPEALEALYLLWKKQQSEAAYSTSAPHTSFSSRSTISTSAAQPLPPTPSSPSPLASVPSTPPSHASPARHRRRQRTARHRSLYERCGHALELILPTLLEAVTAVALVVSMDKERQPIPTPSDSTNAEAAANSSATPAARVHHIKAVNPLQGKKKSGGDRGVETRGPSLSGGACLSLRLNAGCSPSSLVADAASASSDTQPCSCTEREQALASAMAASSAPAVLLMDWLKALVLVWMKAEQPLLLPLPSVGPPSESKKNGEGSEATVIAAPLPSNLLWPDTKAGSADASDVSLGYFVNAQHAQVLGLEAAPVQGPAVQPSYEERREPPLLSARACAIIKDRYSFLF